MSEKISWKELLTRSNVANIVAAIVVIIGLMASIALPIFIKGYVTTDFLVNLVFAAAGYLFGAQVSKSKQ
jgi:hypothetical protein